MTFYRLWVKANTRAEAEGYIYTHLDLETKPRYEPRPVGEPQEYVYTVETSSYGRLVDWFSGPMMVNGEKAKQPVGSLLYFVALKEQAP